MLCNYTLISNGYKRACCSSKLTSILHFELFDIIMFMRKQVPLFLIAICSIAFSCSNPKTESSIESETTISFVESDPLSSTNSIEPSNVSSASSVQASSKSSSVASIPSGPLVLDNSNGIVVEFERVGARIKTIKYDGKLIGQNGFIAGRVANRIAGASFELNGKTYNLNKNEGNNILHGGSKGFGEIAWNVESIQENSIRFVLNSPDGDMGFPGDMTVSTTYTLSSEGELSYEIKATSDKDTIFNPTNHLYMNMNGNTSVSNHSLWIDADKYLSIDNSKLPTGELKDVSNRSSMDYRSKKTYEKGNDRCLCLNGEGYRKVAELTGNSLGITMELFTDRPALQLYDDGQRICLEAQDYIDAIHHDNFPSIVLKANNNWYSKTTMIFKK